MNLRYDVLPGELADPDEYTVTRAPAWPRRHQRSCGLCGDARDVEPVDIGYGCRNWRACLARVQAHSKAPTTAQPASTAAVSA